MRKKVSVCTWVQLASWLITPATAETYINTVLKMLFVLKYSTGGGTEEAKMSCNAPFNKGSPQGGLTVVSGHAYSS